MLSTLSAKYYMRALALILLFMAQFYFDVSRGEEPTFILDVEPPTQLVKIGDPITVDVTITNVSQQDFAFAYAKNAHNAELDVVIDVWRSSGTVADKTQYGKYIYLERTTSQQMAMAKSTVTILIHSGDQWTESSDINKVYDMTMPGTYFGRATLRMSRQDGGPEVTVQSNIISVTVRTESRQAMRQQSRFGAAE
jgi:hypothetical protein